MAQKDFNLENTKPLFVKNNLLTIHNLYIIRSLKATGGGSEVEKTFFASWQTRYYLTLAHHPLPPRAPSLS